MLQPLPDLNVAKQNPFAGLTYPESYRWIIHSTLRKSIEQEYKLLNKELIKIVSIYLRSVNIVVSSLPTYRYFEQFLRRVLRMQNVRNNLPVRTVLTNFHTGYNGNIHALTSHEKNIIDPPSDQIETLFKLPKDLIILNADKNVGYVLFISDISDNYKRCAG